MRGLMDCQGLSVGCFYRILCHSPCVCSSWKHINCGGDVGGEDEECTEDLLLQSQTMLKMNKSEKELQNFRTRASQVTLLERTQDATLQERRAAQDEENFLEASLDR